MSTSQTTTKISAADLREEVRKEYAEVALDPYKGYHFHTGLAAAGACGVPDTTCCSRQYGRVCPIHPAAGDCRRSNR